MMISRFIDWSARNLVLVFVGTIFAVAAGLYALKTLPLDAKRTPFTWKEAYVASPQPDDVYLIGGEASEFGLKDGYVVPIYTLEGSLAAVSFGGPTTVTDVAELASLHFAASYAVGSHLHRKATRKRLTQALTPREYDCLLWAGEGKTDWEISMILGISRSTVLKHVASARQKLGAVNKAHAIATALRIKLLG